MRTLLLPTLEAVDELGGSGSINEIVEAVQRRERFSEEQQAVLQKDGPETEIRYRQAWARTYLKGMGLLDNSSRGVWSLTEAGKRLLSDPTVDSKGRERRVMQMRAAYIATTRDKRRLTNPRKKVDTDGGMADGGATWQEELLDVLMSMAPAGFERLAQRLLREADFDSVNVTGRSGDGGIDGLGVYRLGLVSFPVFFQCKRYRGSVGPGAVRDFRGAMSGRGDKGLLITTGTFTADAKREATRDGAPPVDLIDGSRLCDLLKQYEIGVTTRMVEDVTVEADVFRDA
ncbi:restriction endonuclease [Ornithinimicrobium sufpigmenti]|uniref:restriction endonuclease n=1 Tax=Ornithinimicrobium sufpigmenti TaxID=2508882 RepID=UPI001036984B